MPVPPARLVTQRWPVRVELTGSWTRGQTVVDRRPWTGDSEHDPYGLASTVVDVALGIDGPRYARLWLKFVSEVSAPA
jgi:pyrimidine-specific ribonucleoside hydrolase